MEMARKTRTLGEKLVPIRELDDGPMFMSDPIGDVGIDQLFVQNK